MHEHFIVTDFNVNLGKKVSWYLQTVVVLIHVVHVLLLFYCIQQPTIFWG